MDKVSISPNERDDNVSIELSLVLTFHAYLLRTLARHVFTKECLLDARKGWRKSGHVLMSCIQLEVSNQTDLDWLNGLFVDWVVAASSGCGDETC